MGATVKRRLTVSVMVAELRLEFRALFIVGSTISLGIRTSFLGFRFLDCAQGSVVEFEQAAQVVLLRFSALIGARVML